MYKPVIFTLHYNQYNISQNLPANPPSLPPMGFTFIGSQIVEPE